MTIKLGFLKSLNQFIYTEIQSHEQEIKTETRDLSEIADSNLDLLILDESIDLNASLNYLEREKKYYPIIEGKNIGLNYEKFESLNAKDLLHFFEKIHNRYILNNNLILIENFYKTQKHLNDLWKKDRNGFFEELWFTIKQNLPIQNLMILFNNLDEKDKPSLTLSYVKGEKNPEIFYADAKEKALMDHYKNHFGKVFDIAFYDKEKGELSITAEIGLSPILLIGKTRDLSSLQISLLKGIFQGISIQ